MNERIKELIEECTIITTDMVYDGCDSFLQQTESFDKEKFAELLIREVLDVIQGESVGCNDEWETGLIFAENAIKEHFGVNNEN